MLIREWKREDLPAVRGLLVELSETIRFDFHEDPALLERQFDAMARRPGIYRSFVAETGGMVVGFISLVFYASVLHQKGTALINELVVASAHRGRGVGRALLGHAVALAEREGWDEIEVGVEKFNAKAIGFYKACGLDQESALLGKEFV